MKVAMPSVRFSVLTLFYDLYKYSMKSSYFSQNEALLTEEFIFQSEWGIIYDIFDSRLSTTGHTLSPPVLSPSSLANGDIVQNGTEGSDTVEGPRRVSFHQTFISDCF